MASTNNGQLSSGDALRVRVDTVEREISHIDRQIDAIKDTMASKADIASVQAAIVSLAGKYETAARPNWQAWGVGVTCLIALGTLAYLPIRETTTENRSALVELARGSISIQRFDDNKAFLDRYLAERRHIIDRNIANIDKLQERDRIHSEAIAASSASFKNIDARLEAISRRLAEHIRDYATYRQGVK